MHDAALESGHQTPLPSTAGSRVDGVNHILIVDDSPAQLKVLSRLLQRWGYSVAEAYSGREALRQCAAKRPDLVLSDWMMPGMDGIAFCRRFREVCGPHFAYFILLSSRSEKTELAYGLEAGADDFLTKPLNVHELRARITAAGRIITMQRELAAKSDMIGDTLAKLQAAYDSIDRDLRHARRIQESLVPYRQRNFGRARVSLLLRSCGHVAGDLVGVFNAGPGSIGLFGLDVSGHGIASSMIASRVAGYVSDRHPEQNVALAPGSDGVLGPRAREDVARTLNDRLCQDPGVEEYLTMLYATADLERGQVRLVQAGHPKPLLITAGGATRFLGSGGLPIGLVDEVQHDRLEVALGRGDRLLIYSDGFIEAEMRDATLLGEDGLRDLVAQTDRSAGGPEFLDDLYWRLTQAMNPAVSLADDISAVLLEFRD